MKHQHEFMAAFKPYETANLMCGALYNATSAGQLAAHSISYDAIARAARCLSRMPRSGWRSLQVCDLGCSAGASALALSSRVVTNLRACGVANPIRYGFMDLPGNDWSSLMGTIQSGAYKHHISPQHDVYAYAQAGDFYTRLQPARSVHLYLSMIALHWLAGPPKEAQASLSSTPFVFPQEPGVPEETKALWARKAQADLTLFLDLRAEELRPGCEAILLMVGGDIGPQEWLTRGGPAGDRGVLREALRRAVQAGDIDETTAFKCNVSAYFRSEAEVRAAAAAVPSLEVVEVCEHTISIAHSTGKASGAMGDLLWSIFASSLTATGELGPRQIEHIRSHLDVVLDEAFGVDEGARHTYLLLVVRRKLDGPDPDQQLGVFME